jgi:hypothetical protein
MEAPFGAASRRLRPPPCKVVEEAATVDEEDPAVVEDGAQA